ncbi:hypothetical protein HK414_03825 [Ramlibacter terrae]|uniref:HPt domain-containing protein n=1 Tax=Ramlibacter terrae TaxID=2732511 RepID=A0ABX6P1G7_9BURK|nr:hypothetical protein HK414_03825 [Ramlibacter terrae]
MAEAAPEPVADARVPRDEQVKVIGTLRIGIPLYNVYLNEADEWSRRLATEISEWALEMNQRVPDSTVGWAHSLAGSSATVGFHALSEIARALEGALQHTQSIACGTPAHAQTFTEAAEEVRRLLHQFAAGFLKEPDARLLRELQALKDAEGEPRAEPAPAQAPISGFGDLDFGNLPKPEAAAPAYAAPVQSGPMLQPVQNVPVARQAPVVSVSDEDDLDVTDAIDPDLFPIFEEEAAELMPALGGSLRLWAAHPSQREPRDRCCARCTRSRAAPARPARCAWASCRTAWSRKSSTRAATTSPLRTSRNCSSASTPCRRASTRCAPPAVSPRPKRKRNPSPPPRRSPSTSRCPRPTTPALRSPPRRPSPPRRRRRAPPSRCPWPPRSARRAKSPTGRCACARNCWTARSTRPAR